MQVLDGSSITRGACGVTQRHKVHRRPGWQEEIRAAAFQRVPVEDNFVEIIEVEEDAEPLTREI